MIALESKSLKHSLDTSIEETFADMAFMDVTRLEGAKVGFQHNQIMHISFLEPIRGDIALVLPSECKRSLVENIYGDDWRALHDDRIDDCLLEILNVVAGRFLTDYCGSNQTHIMSLPSMLFDEKEIANLDGHSEFLFDAEGMPFKVNINVETSIDSPAKR
ncbi:MAG: hypothetical protein CMN78_05570 [Spirochaetales bacterium]|nr:hypothetical protein [Spirochaetales bacterium]